MRKTLKPVLIDKKEVLKWVEGRLKAWKKATNPDAGMAVGQYGLVKNFIIYMKPYASGQNKAILKQLEAHLKTKEHRREDLDHYIGRKLKKVYMYNNGWGAQQEQGYREAMKVLSKILK